ncbi:MAG: protein kinase [Anaerolineaceae bacterium]|nr:protein kinase [Anaerolineaceae bacterium]
MTELIGQSIDRYLIKDKLGKGGMATVYLAMDTRLERQVALKVLRKDIHHTDNFLKRFEREARVLAQLAHPNIVNVYDFGLFKGTPFLVMAYMENGTLKERVGKSFDISTVLSQISLLARALDYAHKKNIIHRDIKPANILFSSSNTPMLSDFGLAKIITTDKKVMTQLTQEGVGLGTPSYIAPEQVLGKKVDQRVDIYSLGIVLFELMTGRKPFLGDSPMDIAVKQVKSEPPSPASLNSEIPDSITRIILKLLKKDPDQRIQTAEGLANEIDKIIQREVPSIQEQMDVTPKEGVNIPYRDYDQKPLRKTQPSQALHEGQELNTEPVAKKNISENGIPQDQKRMATEVFQGNLPSPPSTSEPKVLKTVMFQRDSSPQSPQKSKGPATELYDFHGEKSEGNALYSQKQTNTSMQLQVNTQLSQLQAQYTNFTRQGLIRGEGHSSDSGRLIKVKILIPPSDQVEIRAPAWIPSQLIASAVGKACWGQAVEEQICIFIQKRIGISEIAPLKTFSEVSIKENDVLKLAALSGMYEKMAYLKSIIGIKFKLEKNNIIGRKSSGQGNATDIDLSLFDTNKVISRNHAVIEFKSGKFYLIDKNSRNGTWLNGDRIPGERPFVLETGSVLDFGRPGRGAKMTFYCI